MSLSQLKSELNRTWPLPDAPTHGDDELLTLPTPRGAISCTVKQVPRRHFLMTVQTCEVHLQLPIDVADGTHAKLHYSGWLLRGPLVFRASAGRPSPRRHFLPAFMVSLSNHAGLSRLTLRQAQGERSEAHVDISSVATLATRLCNSTELHQALTHVDFTRLDLIGCGNSLRVELALYGGSELRSSLPGLQRYIGLGAQQIHALRQSLQLISNVLLSTP